MQNNFPEDLCLGTRILVEKQEQEKGYMYKTEHKEW